MTTTFSMDQFLAISRVLAASEAECAALRGECESLGVALAKARDHAEETVRAFRSRWIEMRQNEKLRIYARGFPASRAVLTALGFEDAGDCEDSEP